MRISWKQHVGSVYVLFANEPYVLKFKWIFKFSFEMIKPVEFWSGLKWYLLKDWNWYFLKNSWNRFSLKRFSLFLNERNNFNRFIFRKSLKRFFQNIWTGFEQTSKKLFLFQKFSNCFCQNRFTYCSTTWISHKDVKSQVETLKQHLIYMQAVFFLYKFIKP